MLGEKLAGIFFSFFKRRKTKIQPVSWNPQLIAGGFYVGGKIGRDILFFF
jgi:hypothetical protein